MIIILTIAVLLPCYYRYYSILNGRWTPASSFHMVVHDTIRHPIFINLSVGGIKKWPPLLCPLE